MAVQMVIDTQGDSNMDQNLEPGSGTFHQMIPSMIQLRYQVSQMRWMWMKVNMRRWTSDQEEMDVDQKVRIVQRNYLLSSMKSAVYLQVKRRRCWRWTEVQEKFEGSPGRQNNEATTSSSIKEIETTTSFNVKETRNAPATASKNYFWKRQIIQTDESSEDDTYSDASETLEATRLLRRTTQINQMYICTFRLC